MELARKSGKMWHFAEHNYCGWAKTFKERDEFEETIEVSSLDEVGEFCSMCEERRKD